MGDFNPLPEEQTIAIDQRLNTLMQHAVLTGDLDPMVKLVDWLIAEGFCASGSRGGLLARQLFDTAIRHGLHPDGPYVVFGEHLVEQGWCSRDELQNGAAERLFVSGLAGGELPAYYYDWLVDLRRDGYFNVWPMDRIRRIET